MKHSANHRPAGRAAHANVARRRAACFLAAAATLALGCGSAGRVDQSDDGAAAGGTTGAAGAAGNGSGGFLGGGAGTAGASGGTQFDGCQNVDVLFAIDDSGSMGDKQQALAAAFPGFAKTMREKLSNAVSYHVGVVTSDNYYKNVAGCQDIGDLVVKTGGPLSSNATCGPFGGKNYLDGTDPDLNTHFQCVAKVGAGGDDNERIMRGLLNAVDPKRNAPGKCNAGFARPDSLLIIVLIADEDDAGDPGCDPLMGACMTGSGGTSTDWYDELVAYRGGVADNIVVLSLVNADKSCAGSIGARLTGFSKKFKNSAVGNVCTLDYAQFFDDALPTIGAACEKYTPVK